MKTLTCLNCKRVSFGVSQKYAEDEVRDFNKFYDSQKDKNNWKGPSSIDNYKCCKDMKLRLFIEGDCPNGVTIGPVIWSESE